MVLVKLFILLYADDTVILSESAEDLQLGRKAYEEYCSIWELEVNIAKTNVLIFAKAKIPNYEFKYKDEILEVISAFKYLVILFSKNNSFFKKKQQQKTNKKKKKNKKKNKKQKNKQIADHGTKAVKSLLKKARNMQLPINIQVELFNKLVKPSLLYGCEV